jgi:excisionase family DNA binding protein
LTSVNIIDTLTSVNVILRDMPKKAENNRDDLEDLITLSEAAKIRGVTRQAIHAIIARGHLQAVNLFGRVLLHRSEVEAYEKKKPGPSPKKGDDNE